MSTEQNAMTDAEEMEQDGLIPITEAMYEAIEAIYVEAQDAQKVPLPQDQLDSCIDELEALAGALPGQRTLYTTDDSEVIMEHTATCVAWEEAANVKTIKALLGDPKMGTKKVNRWKCVTGPHGLASMWTAESGEKVLVYAAGEGRRVEGWHMENKSQEVETMSAHIEKPEVLKILSRKLGVLPKDEEKRMTVLRAQQSSIIKALSYAMGEDSEVWEEYKFPKLMASMSGKATNAAQSAQYTLKRKSEHKSEIHLKELKVKILDEQQRKPGGTSRGALDRDKLLLATGKPGGGIGRALLSFEENTGSRPSIAIMGMHLCAGDKLVRNHEEGVACVKAMRRTARLLPPGLRAKRAGEKLCERLTLREEEQCPLFTVWSVKLGKLAPCEAGRGCRGSIGSCRPGRWAERGAHLPQDVLAIKVEWEAEEKAEAEERMKESMQQERAVNRAYVTAKRPAAAADLTSPPPRRSPRREGGKGGKGKGGGGKGGEEKGGGGKGGEEREGGGKGAGGKGGGGKGNGKPFQFGSSGGRGEAASSAAAPAGKQEAVGRTSSAAAPAGKQEAVKRTEAQRAEGAGAEAAASAPTAPERDEAERYLLGLPPAEATAEGGAAAQAAASGAPAGENVTSKEAAGGAAETAKADEVMGENGDDDVLRGVPPGPVGSPTSADWAQYAAAAEFEGEDPMSAGRSSNGKGAVGSGSAGTGGRRHKPPTPVPMMQGGIAKSRKSSPRNKGQ